LHDAAESGNVIAVREIVACGTDINSVNRYGETALYLAASNCHAEVVEFPLVHGADANVSASERKQGLAALVHGANSPLDEAMIWQHSEVVKLLIAKHADVNATDNFG
jgi:ankyrin repeat protein